MIDLVGLPHEIAPRLLGFRLRTEFEEGATEVVITEVEAYSGGDDPASHAFSGRTARNGPMFGPPGHLYVYRSYGMHWCSNIVVNPPGQPSAVLIRGGEITEGIDIIKQRRGRSDNLVDGPGKLSQALGITGDHDGAGLDSGPIRLIAGSPLNRPILTTPRIGISKAVDYPWRFVAAAEIATSGN
ncbi:MAG: DNA-3-methyladenine glycosylase [Acidimicrobiia bacterium]|nr:DNA-3-methyladenine glycosylase [Acidimicrobiia bacterium]NNC41892.1 DNA-3-methyladenine glycosylase [Acidimicrobiia bacterium]NND13917.1 DNA-3-methyladenine glycosylase [Acidimicrobiia bacterium]NNL28034.1 DNA-3-methyladenine glycosylase [Acidimicrobiia bacterium]